MYRIHLFFREIQFRLMYLVLSLVMTFLICSSYSQSIIFFLTGNCFTQQNQIDNLSFDLFNITEGFFLSLQVSFKCTLYLNFFVVLYHLWSFYIPSCTQNIRRKFTRYLFWFCILSSLADLCFLHSIFPFFWNFFLNQHMELTSSSAINLTSYIVFVDKVFLFSQLIFEVPLACFILLEEEILSFKALVKIRSSLYCGILCFIALISPGDLKIQIGLSFVSILSLEVFFFFYFCILQYQKDSNESLESTKWILNRTDKTNASRFESSRPR